MHCPFCHTAETKVVDSRLADDGSQVRRRRECIQCNERFTTYETIEYHFPRVIKRDGVRVVFSVDKLRGSFLKALDKRPVSLEVVDAAVNRILHTVRSSGEREISTQVLGEHVMNELRSIDQVGYVRFASVYRSFQDVSEFHREIEKLQQHEL